MLVIYLCLNIETMPNLGFKDFMVDSNFTLNFYGKKMCAWHKLGDSYWMLFEGKSEGIST